MENKLLAARAVVPGYDRSRLVTRIVHLEFGASLWRNLFYFRALQRIYSALIH